MGMQSHNIRSKTHSRTIKRVAQTFVPYKFQVLLILLLILLSTGLNTIELLMVQRIFDDGIGKRNFTWLLIGVGVMIVIPIVSGVIDVWETYLNNAIGQNILRNLRNRLYQHLQSMSLRFFTATQTGEIQSCLSNDINGVQAAVTDTAPTVVSNIAEVASAVIAMLVLSPLLTGAMLGLLPICLWINTKESKLRRIVSAETQQSLARLSTMIQETLSVSGILLLKTFGRQAYAQKLFERENQRLTDLEVQQQMIGRWFFMLIGASFRIINPIIYLIAGWQIISGLGPSLTIGTIVAFAGLQWKLFIPTESLLNMQIEIQGALALFDRVFEYLDMQVEIKDVPHAVSLIPKKTQGRLSFKHVTFTYKRDASATSHDLAEKSGENGTNDPASGKSSGPLPLISRSSAEQQPESGESLEETMPRPVLKNVSFDILPGQMVALVGPSGAGKTTISYLLPRFYDVDSGSVEIDGHNVKDVTLASLSEVIGMVTQETYLLHASVRENLLYARLDATEEEMIAATKAAAIHDRIMELDDGYDTIVGERGYRLSGGEKQRIAIARVILKNPRILILDEATSALDTHSEQLIQAALEPLMKERTTLVIAHRLSTILAADMILVMHKGEIIERGTHQKLLALGGFYAQLYHKQFGQAFQKVIGAKLEEKRREEKRSSIPLKRGKPLPAFLDRKEAHFSELKRSKQNLSIKDEIYKYQCNIRKLTSDKNREMSEYLIDDRHFFVLKILNKYNDMLYSEKQQKAIQEVLKSLHQFAFKALEILPLSDPEGPSELNPLLENLKAAVRGLKKEMGEITISVELNNESASQTEPLSIQQAYSKKRTPLQSFIPTGIQ